MSSPSLEEVQKQIAGFAARKGSNVTQSVSKVKKPVSKDEYYEMAKGFDFYSMQLAGDYAAYYYTRMPQYMKQSVIMPDGPVIDLERAIDPRLENLTFTKIDGTQTEPLKEFLAGPARKQAMMMMHKGKVVFESYPGMNPNDLHLWMSSGKTTVSIVFAQLVEEGKINMNDMSSKYVPELQGSLWDEVPVWATCSMNSALDIEETPVTMISPGAWIHNFHSTFLGDCKTPYMEQLKTVKPMPNGEKPGEPATMRYSSANTLVCQYIIEAIEQKPFSVVFQERIWSKLGVRNPSFICLAPDGTNVGYGMFSSTPEDMLKYAMAFTPSANKVLYNPKVPLVTEKMQEIIRSPAKPQAFEGSSEQVWAHKWFGEKPPKNGLQWDNCFDDGGMFKHGNNGKYLSHRLSCELSVSAVISICLLIAFRFHFLARRTRNLRGSKA